MRTPSAPPNPPRALLLDMDGVLIDSFEAWVATLDECRERRGLSPLGRDGVAASWGQGIAEDCRTLFPGTPVPELAAEYDEGFARHVGLVRVIPGAAALVEAALARGLALAVVTNSPVAMSRRALAAAGLGALVERVSGGDEVERGKPDPALVRLALERLRMPATSAVMVGDTSLDVEAARGAGVFVLGYRCPADHRVEELSEVAVVLGLELSG